VKLILTNWGDDCSEQFDGLIKQQLRHLQKF
jgi:hypothetical protein